MWGRGRAIWQNGNVYEGEYRRNQRSGVGTFWYSDGSEYVGEWKDDKKHGKGRFKDKSGQYKEG